ncbi:Uncharacterized conserved protein YtfP, gamma-glutamylcyclotransferase (GGCT)/AIG2-like family [Geodermatophilus amargosae]|uniref:Uncharacterized conserved protein YtfP, gamma-glutamylcyclotransferase (GGCT)/AIG2-like family n=1 Tax=Geodermatophilus amargosae TaxID=1296565 RepID=A0A1I7BHV3_9ACTN|nr:gamma-glutamylcyclotransferase family protein [Geodermatophilus amargosae]SFT86748.1 Uncharacterized conserved protein YtfP, gamma-glutamylcyclotransferase (GGCT)/AIG2-like family [Geodermatophilus amargosae]
MTTGTNACHRLAIYGSLAPGRPNHHQVAGLDGLWFPGRVHGRLVEAGWGASLGYPALIVDPDGWVIDVDVLESEDLPGQWSRLDDFEGPGYERVLTTVHTAAGELEAHVYVLSATDES